MVRLVIVDPRSDSRPYDHGLGAALAARGHDVELAACRFHHGDLPPAPGVRVRECFYRLADRLPSRFRRLGRGAEHLFDLAVLILRFVIDRPDAIHVQWLPLGAVDRFAWRIAGRLVRRPIVYTAHNAIPKLGVGSAGQVVADCAPFDAVVVHSAAGAASLRDLGVPDRRIVRVPHGALDGYADVRAIAPQRIPAGAPVAAFAGLIRPYKGLGDLLAVWPTVRRAVPDAVLAVSGRPLGADADAAQAMALDRAGAGVVADIRYIPAGEFAGLLRRADLVVLPYRSIDQSGVLFSAIALGRPLVVTDVGGLGEVIVATGAGIVVAPGDGDALADAIIRLLCDGELREAMGAAGLAAATGAYSWAVAAERSEALYGRLRSSRR